MEQKDRNYIINYKGKEILFHDHSGLNNNDLLTNVKAAFKLVDQNNKGKDTLSLSKWSDCIMTSELMEYLKSDDCIRISKSIKKTAVLGLVGIKKIFLSVYNKLTGDTTRNFNTEEEAKEWLVKD